MAAKPKLSPDQWAVIRTTWETDPCEADAWLVEEMGLDVSASMVWQLLPSGPGQDIPDALCGGAIAAVRRVADLLARAADLKPQIARHAACLARVPVFCSNFLWKWL
jgi:hypothetical protein